MRIQHNISALNAHKNLSMNNSALSKNLEKLSSGYRINRAGDDAAGLAISESMRAQVSGLETATKNAEDGISMIQTAEGALTEVHSMLNRMVELTTQSANGTYNVTSRQAMQDEMDQLASEIDRISTSTKFNGTELFTSNATDVTFQVSQTSSDGDQLVVSFEEMNSDTLGVSGLDVTDQENSRQLIDVVNTAIEQVSTKRGSLGAAQNRLEHTINNLNVTTENITAAEARVRDVDMAKEMMQYTKNNILVQASQAMLAQANTVPQGVLQLLQ